MGTNKIMALWFHRNFLNTLPSKTFSLFLTSHTKHFCYELYTLINLIYLLCVYLGIMSGLLVIIGKVIVSLTTV